MTDAQRVALGDTLAGQNQYKVLASVMQNFQHAIDATNTALNSAGSAAKENAAYMESLEAREQALKAEFEDFANRVLSKDLVGGFVDAGTSILDFANNDVGAAITRIGLLATGMTGLTGIAGQTIGKIAEVGLQLKNLGVGGDSFLGMLASGKIALIVGGAVAAIALLAEAIRAIKNAYDEAHPSFEDANKNLQETQTEIQNTTTELEEYKKKLQELDDIDPKDRGAGWAAERAELETNVQTAEAYLEVLKQIEQAQTGKVEGSKYITGYTGQNVGDYTDGYIGTEASGQLKVTESQVKAITAEYTTQEEAVMSISLALKDYITGWDTFKDMSIDEVVEELNSQLSAFGINVHSTTETISESFDNMGELADSAADGFNNLTKAEQDQATQYLSDYQAYVQGVVDSGKLLDASQKKNLQNYINLQMAASGFNATQASSADIIAYVASQNSLSADAAARLAAALGYIDSANINVASGMVQLADSTWALKENCYKATDGLYYLKDGCDALGDSGDEVADAMSQISSTMAEVQGSTDQFVGALFDMNGKLTTTGQAVLTGNQGLWELASAEAAANQAAAQANFDNLVNEILTAGQAASWSAQQIAQMFAYAGLSTGAISSTYGDITTDKRAQMAYGAREFRSGENLQSYLTRVAKENLEKAIKESDALKNLGQNLGYATSTGGGGSSKSAEEKAAAEAEKQAKKAQQAQEKAAKESQSAYESAAKSAKQAAQDAARAAEKAAEEAKQKILDAISELKDASDKFWESKTDAVEETNKELDRQKQLEEKLKALEEAKQKKILLYKNGQFQYDKDYGTIAKAQADYEETRDKIHREKELEQLKEMKDNATEIFNEMKDIVQNGGDVTQEMINSWLSQMQADGADYYDSNKQMLSEWLDWAKSAISEISNQVTSATGGSGGADSGYYSGSGSVSGQWSHQDETNPYVSLGQDTIQEMLEWIKKIDKYQDDEEFMNEIILRAASAGYIIPSNAGLRGNLKMNLIEALQKILAPYQNLIETNTSSPYVYAWKGLFKSELQRGLDLGSNTVFAGYQDKLLSGTIDDPYEGQEYYQRNQAIKALYNEYKEITDQLGYIPDYLKDFMDMGSKMLSNVDLVARKMAENYDNLSTSGKSLLDSLVSGEEDYEAANKMRIAYLAENYSPERLRYMNLVWAAGSSRNAMQLMNQRTEEDKARDEALYGDWLNDLRDKIDKAGGVVTDEIYNWYLKTAGGALGSKGTGDAQLYADVFASGGKYLYSDQEELERLGYHGFLGNFGNISEGGLSDATKNLVKSKILTSTTETNIDKQKEQITQNNIKGIKDTLEKYQEGYGATQHWIDDATKYITDTLNKNNEALLTADAETRKSLLAQNEELMGIRDSLGGVEADEDINKLPGTTTAYADWEFKIDNPTDEELAERAEQRAQKLADQMAANSAAWWEAGSKAEQDALHKANEELAKQINELTGSNLTYEGSSGTWSKNASGTHNFRGGLSLVGERGPELRVLGQGDNVIPAYQTANLWKWSSTTPDSMLKTLELRKGDGRNSYIFNVSKLELPNVSNAKEFVAGLKNYALQYSYRR